MSRRQLKWAYHSFDMLSPRQLYEVIRARETVFATEQKINYVDCDGTDPSCLHLMGHIDGELVAYLRVCPPGTVYEELSFGRVLTAPAYRGQGYGRALIDKALILLTEAYPGHMLKISAQSYLIGFYQSFGFSVKSKPYIEEGIEHVKMRLQII